MREQQCSEDNVIIFVSYLADIVGSESQGQHAQVVVEENMRYFARMHRREICACY